MKKFFVHSWKQRFYRLIELRYFIKYWREIPKGVRRTVIELCIILGELSKAYKKTDMQGEIFDAIFKTADDELKYIKEYKEYLRGEQK